MAKSDKLYSDSPKIERGEDGKHSVKKPEKADAEDAGVEGVVKDEALDPHEEERSSLYKRHQEEQSAMHDRHKKDLKEMHKRHTASKEPKADDKEDKKDSE